MRAARETDVRREYLDAVVEPVGDVDVSGRTGGDAVGDVELTVAAAIAAPLGDEGAGRVELLDAVVAGIDDVDVSCRVGGDAPGVG